MNFTFPPVFIPCWYRNLHPAPIVNLRHPVHMPTSRVNVHSLRPLRWQGQFAVAKIIDSDESGVQGALVILRVRLLICVAPEV